jgi:hypothetical protein
MDFNNTSFRDFANLAALPLKKTFHVRKMPLNPAFFFVSCSLHAILGLTHLITTIHHLAIVSLYVKKLD